MPARVRLERRITPEKVQKSSNAPDNEISSSTNSIKTGPLQKASDHNPDQIGQINMDDMREDTDYIQLLPSQFDHALKYAALHQSKGDTKIVSSFTFHGECNTGHRIIGKRPVVVYPFGDEVLTYGVVNQRDLKCRLVYVLTSLVGIHKGDEGLCIICFDAIDAQLYEHVIKSIKIPVALYTPALGIPGDQPTEEELNKLLKTHIIVTDHIGCRGMEFSKVIVSIGPKEHCLHQYLIEGFTRSLGDLYFTLIDKGLQVQLKNNIVCADIIAEWEKKELVEKLIIRSCTDDKCRDSSQLCSKTYNVHTVHPNSNLFDFVDVGEIVKIQIDEEASFLNYMM